VTDDPTLDPAEYDPSICTAFCPDCGCPLKFCDPLGFPEDCNWFCPGCENFFADKEIKSEPIHHKLCRWCAASIDMEWYRATAFVGCPSDSLCRDCFEEDD
jgi:hypothetical protein